MYYFNQLLIVNLIYLMTKKPKKEQEKRDCYLISSINKTQLTWLKNPENANQT